MRKLILRPLVVLFIILFASTALAEVIDANIFTEFYGYESRVPDEQNQIRSLQGIRLGVHDAFVPGLSFFAQGRVASDLSNKFSSDPDVRVYGAYLQYAPERWFSARAGRQFVYAGLGGLTLDGGRLDLSYKGATLTGFVGTTPGPSFFDYDAVKGWDESNAYGGRLRYNGLPYWIFGVSFLQRNLNENLESKIGGFDFAYSRGIFSEFVRIDYEMHRKIVKLATVRPRVKLSQGHTIDMEYSYRRPMFGLSNMFSMFKNEPFHQVRLNPTLKLGDRLYGLATFAYTILEDDDNGRISAGASYKGQSAGITFSDGYGGTRLGVFASLSKRLLDKLDAYLYGDMFNYRIDTNEEDTTPSLAASLGANYQMMKGLNSRGEIQLLSNRDLKYDTRFYLKIDYGFRLSGTDRESGGGTDR